MNREYWLNFLVTGSVMLPVILYFGTGSLDSVALCLAVFMLLEMALLVICPDDPIGDKMRADELKKGKLPPPSP